MSMHARPMTLKPDQLSVELVESLSDLLGAMLVAEWTAQHSESITEPAAIDSS